jgi:uncharacterized protein
VTDLLAALDWSDPRLAAVAATAFAAGLVRGFTGFGAGMVFIPAASAIYDPVTAVVLLVIIDYAATLPLLPPHLKAAQWREVGPATLAASLAFPLGLTFLLTTDPVVTRWILSLFVLSITLILAAGRRYTGEPHLGLTLGVGGGVGFLSGMIGLGGPLVVLFWLGGPARSNIFAFFGLFSAVSIVGYWWSGIFTRERVALSLLLLPLYAMPLVLGSKLFDRSSDETYRRVALALCFAIALATLPVWRG